MRSLIITVVLIGLAYFAYSEGLNGEEGAKSGASDQTIAWANGESVEVQFLQGKAYWDGIDVPMDRKRAVECYRKAALDNHPDALAGLGAAYGMGQGVDEKDERIAAEYFRKAAGLGSAVGQMNLGMMLISGKAVEKNVEEGVRWIEKAAGVGFVKAQVYLAELYTAGDAGIPRDWNKAAQWAARAAEQGDSKAMNLYGVMLRDGAGAEPDPTKAVSFFRKAADQGYLKAFLNLGSAYFYGKGVEMDKVAGMSWWFAGEKLGDGSCRETAVRLVAGIDPELVAKALEIGSQRASEKLQVVLKAGQRR